MTERGELEKWGSRLWEDLRALEAASDADDRTFIDRAVSTVADLEATILHVRSALQLRTKTPDGTGGGS